jgi:glycosyltransferase involved in cell wall biosynthesis
MRIAQLAGPFLRVPPFRYGGTERVISTLTEELVRRGHDVTLFAPGTSRTSARLIPFIPEPAWHHQPAYEFPEILWNVVQGTILRHLDQFEILHSHLELFGFPLARISGGRMVTTLHYRQDLPEALLVHNEFSDVPLVSISNAQRAPVPEANWLATVYHGIELNQFTFRAEPGSYLAFLGRISPEKGLDAAIRVAEAAGMPIKVAARLPRGGVSGEEERDRVYYREEVLPLIERHDVEFVGEISGSARDDFLGHAAALLFPVRWPEPFGLVMPESMACGTPVIALKYGSVPEIIEDGATGFVCATEEEMVQATSAVGQIDRARCRETVERRFSVPAMVDAYEHVYTACMQATL